MLTTNDSSSGTSLAVPGYDKFGRKLGSWPAINYDVGTRQFVNALQFQSGYQIQSSNINVNNFKNNGFIDLSEGAFAVGTIAAGTRSVFTTTLTPNAPVPIEYLNFAIPIMSLFVGGTDNYASQLWPGPASGVDVTSIPIMSGFDRASPYTGTNTTFRVTVQNNTGAPLVFCGTAQWKYTDHGVVNP